jgi:hypothetical protein
MAGSPKRTGGFYIPAGSTGRSRDGDGIAASGRHCDIMMGSLLVANIGRRVFSWCSSVVWCGGACLGGVVFGSPFAGEVFLSSASLFLSFPLPSPHLSVRQAFSRFSLPPASFPDHLRSLAAGAGRTGAQLLDGERSGSVDRTRAQGSVILVE